MSNPNTLQTATDKDGRVITFMGLSVLEQIKVFRVVKAENAENGPYVGMVMVMLTARSIDGVPLPWPTSEALLDAHMEKVGDSGWLLLSPHFRSSITPDAEAAPSSESYLKNS